MKCLFLSLQQLLQLFGALQSKMTVFFAQEWLLPRGGEQNFSDYFGVNSDKEATALFSVHFAPSPPSLSAECQVSLGLRLIFFFYYCLIFMSMLFQSRVSGSHCLCLTGRLNVLAFLQTTDTATGCHVEKRKKKVLFLWKGAEREEKKKEAATAELPHLSVGERVRVCVCVYMCECVFLCANRQRAEVAERDGSRM